MQTLRVHRRLVKWGNAYGIRVTRKEAERLGLRERDPVHVELQAEARGIQVDRLTPIPMGRHASTRHDEWARRAAECGH